MTSHQSTSAYFWLHISMTISKFILQISTGFFFSFSVFVIASLVEVRLGIAVAGQVSEYPIVVEILEGEQVVVEIVEFSVMGSLKVPLIASTSSVSILSETRSNLSLRQDHVVVMSPMDSIKPLFLFLCATFRGDDKRPLRPDVRS